VRANGRLSLLVLMLCSGAVFAQDTPEPGSADESARATTEPQFLSPTYAGRFDAEFQQFRDLGVDGIFTDFPDVAFRVLRVPLATAPRK